MAGLAQGIPLWVVALLLFVFFAAVMGIARGLSGWRRDEEAREDLSGDAGKLITGLAASFAFFVGLSITVTWGAVSAGQTAVEQQASAIRNMNWSLNNLPNRAEGTRLREQLAAYAVAAAYDDEEYLARGETQALPSAVPLDTFQDSLHTYAYGPTAPAAEVSSLVSAATTIGTSAATVSVVAQRKLPPVVAVLLLVSGLLVAVIMGIASVDSRYPLLMFLWCAIPALSITVVIALATPFGSDGIGVNLAPMRTVAEQVQ